jgi:amino acid transporter
MTTQTASAANKLKHNSIGVALLTFMVISAAAPLTGIAGAMPLGMLLGNGAGIPGTFVLMTILFLIWAVGYVTLARDIKNAGAFYAYSSRALGGKVGGAVSMMALLSYNAMMVGLLGLLGGVAAGVLGGFGLSLPWWAWSIIATVLIGILGYRQVDLSAKVLFVLVVLECVIALIVALAILAAGGAGDLKYNILDPGLIFGGTFTAAVLFVFGSFIGVEATAIYSEEVREPDKNVPLATYFSIALIGIFYVFVTWLMVVGTGVDKLAPTIGGLPAPTDYFFALAGQYAGETVAMVMGVLLVTSVFASASAMHNFIARYTYVAGREGLLPESLGVTHNQHQSPHMGSLVQTVLALVVVGIFAVLQLDPVLNLFTWIAQISILGVLAMMSITSFAVIVYFNAHENGASTWSTKVAPAIAGVIMGLLSLYVLFTFGPATGTTAPLSFILPGLVPLAAIIGYFVAAGLQSRDPKRFAQLGSNAWATTDAVQSAG